MRKLSEYQDKEAVEVLAELLEPVVTILAEPEIAKYMRVKNYVKAIPLAIKMHVDEVMQIMAILEETPLEEYHCNIATLPMLLLGIINDPVLKDFFTVQAQEMSLEISSGPATENIEEQEEQGTSSTTL